MKKSIISLLLLLSLLLCSCFGAQPTDTESDSSTETQKETEESYTSIDTIFIPNITTGPAEDTVAKDTDKYEEETENKETEGEQTSSPVISVTYDYITDISKYEKYIDPEDRDGFLILVNPDHPLDEDYVPSDLTDLVDTRDDGRATQQMVYEAAMALEAFLIEARAAGCKNVTVTSAYRSYARQDYLFNSYVYDEMAEDPSLTREEAEAIVVKESCRAGTSEHQAGLCCDMHNIGSANQSFAKKFEAKWLAENCYKFGFILRFPEDKQDITKIIYEPWHFRFVGRYHATKIHELGMCLEEYIEYLE